MWRRRWVGLARWGGAAFSFFKSHRGCYGVRVGIQLSPWDTATLTGSIPGLYKPTTLPLYGAAQCTVLPHSSCHMVFSGSASC